MLFSMNLHKWKMYERNCQDSQCFNQIEMSQDSWPSLDQFIAAKTTVSAQEIGIIEWYLKNYSIVHNY